MRSSLAVCAALLAAICLAACGGESSSTSGADGSSAEDEAKAAATAAVENDDAASFCREQVSAAYLQRIYGGDIKKCVASAGSVPEVGGKATASAAVLKPDERHAEVTVSIEGGSLDGTSGGVEMVKQGKAWKLDDFADDFLRSSFQTAIRTADEGALSTPGMKACFSRQLKTLPAGTVRHLTYLSDAGAQEAENAGLLKLAEKCPQSALAEYGARTLTDELDAKGKHKPGYARCLYGEIKAGLELTKITTKLFGEHPDLIAVGALEGIVEGAKQNCGG